MRAMHPRASLSARNRICARPFRRALLHFINQSARVSMNEGNAELRGEARERGRERGREREREHESARLRGTEKSRLPAIKLFRLKFLQTRDQPAPTRASSRAFNTCLMGIFF